MMCRHHPLMLVNAQKPGVCQLARHESALLMRRCVDYICMVRQGGLVLGDNNVCIA